MHHFKKTQNNYLPIQLDFNIKYLFGICTGNFNFLKIKGYSVPSKKEKEKKTTFKRLKMQLIFLKSSSFHFQIK